MEGIILKKNGSLLEFYISGDKRVMYDFKDNSFISHTGNVVKPATLKTWFRKHVNIANREKLINVEESDEMYLKLIKYIFKKEHRTYNLGTILEKLHKYKYVEKYMTQGYNVVDYIGEHTDIKMSKISKPIKDVIKKLGIDVLVGANRFNSLDKGGLVFLGLLEKIDNKQLVLGLDRFDIERMDNLVNTYNYNIKSLVNYIYNINEYEAMPLYEVLMNLEDYIRMNTQMGARNADKYPRYLHSMHDIVVRNFNNYKREYELELFKKAIKPELEFTGKEYSIIYPKHYKEIQEEGASLSHCVGSYIDRILEGKTHIVFLRKNDSLEKSLVTVEIKRNNIIQYKGKFNYAPTEEEMEFLRLYADKKGLEIIK